MKHIIVVRPQSCRQCYFASYDKLVKFCKRKPYKDEMLTFFICSGFFSDKMHTFSRFGRDVIVKKGWFE